MIESETKTDVRNALLSRLSDAEKNSLFPSLEMVEFSPREVVYEPRQQLKYAYFPETCVMSKITVLEDGTEIEAATIGNEGMVGIPILLAAQDMPSKIVCQIGGTAWRVEASELSNVMQASPSFYLLLRKYAQALFEILAQGTACNRLHTIEQRCARWLLSAHDRVVGDTFSLTHEFLATMLGVRRPGVSLVAKALQDNGLVSYKHGRMTITNRAGLEGVSCECYAATRANFNRLV